MTARKKTTPKTTQVKATTHDQDTRTNIPTAELEKFAEDDERKPTTLLYRRDPSLDPQLVWAGKDEQDRTNLEVPAVPIYIQETIEPQSIIEDLRRHSKEGSPDAQAALFGDSFGGLDFEDRVEFYKHSGKWTNRLILGDSLLVMASLADKEGLKGQVQMIYVDPPYGIRFGSNWQVSTWKRDVKDGNASAATRQPEQIRAFRDTWELGIHSYLSYLRDRFTAARDLLSETGSIFVQIGDQNVHLVRSVLDEVFGSQNFVSLISFATTTGFETLELARAGDYLLWYGRDRSAGVKVRPLYRPRDTGEEVYRSLLMPDGSMRTMTAAERRGDEPLPAGSATYYPDNLISQGAASVDQPFEHAGKTYSPGANSHWKAKFPEGMNRLAIANRIHVSSNSLRYVRRSDDFPWRGISNLWTDTLTGQFTDEKVFVVQTNTKVLERCLLMTTDAGDLVLDPTSGSGTTAVVAEQWGRRWIAIDTSRVALALARTRLMASRFPYYMLADSTAGVAKEAELSGLVSNTVSHGGDIKKGFVYKRVPHVTLKSIANNPDIGEGSTREEIEAAIARNADTEVLYDRPYEEPGIVRVTGPFTVESLSPHRVDLDGPEDESATAQAIGLDAARFVEGVIEELRKAGVQNTYKEERLIFGTLERYAGVYVQAVGTYIEDGKSKTAAVTLGPEYGTVGKELVREAAKEAAEFADVLIVCGFAFEALVEDESKVGKLRVMKAKMNPDLQMPDLLKKTGAGNLFMVFGEPDIGVETGQDDTVTVEVRGLDVYDPTTGQIRSNTTNDIACWFIDTDYNGETFFVRHAYFLGSDDPYGKLKRALKADIDEDGWASLHSTASRPFARPSSRRIAVKVINHYGDEVLKVYDV